jgi:hypothetical protein
MNGALLTGTQISEVADSQPPAPVVALGRSDTGIVAWEPDTGSVQGRLYTGATPQGEVQLSNAALGPVQPGGGLAAASDAGGDQLVAFTQGTPGALQIAVAANVPAPSAPGPLTSAAYMPNALPVLSWTAAPQHWGAVSYAVLIDGNQVGKTTATTFTPAAPLTNGAHTWQVISIDSVGQETPGPIRPLRIDTLLPTVALAIAGAHRVHSKLTFKVTLHPAKGSHVLISYGDGASSKSVRSHHAYRRAGTYTVKVTVTDHARHSEVLTSRLHIS